MLESNFMRTFWKLAMSVPGLRLFRNNVGQAWIGRSRRNSDGTVTIDAPRAFHAGLCAGSADLIGIAPMEIKKEHVGLKVGVFVAVETKNTKGLTEEQDAFLRFIHSSGGVAIVATTEGDIDKLLTWQPGRPLDPDIARLAPRKGRKSGDFPRS